MKKNKNSNLNKIKCEERPKVFLVGNGINLLFKDIDKSIVSTEEILRKQWHANYRGIDYPNSLNEMSFPMKVVVTSRDNVDSCMGNLADSYVEQQVCQEQKEFIQNGILSLKPDVILTTNYSLEFEKTCIDTFSKSKIYDMYRYTTDMRSNEDQFGIYRYISLKNFEIPLWHIHGICLKKDSMVMGQYFYGKLLAEVIKRSKDFLKEYRTAQTKGNEIILKSWVDYFLLGDVYCFGFEMPLCESDIWWLLSYKKTNFPNSHLFYFHNNQLSEEKMLLLNCYNVKTNMIKEYTYGKYYDEVLKTIKLGNSK